MLTQLQRLEAESIHIFSVRSAQHRWDPKAQRPELWHVYNGRRRPGENIRVFPLSNWTELDVWHYIRRERIPVVPLYFAAERPVVERDGALIMVDADRRGRELRRQPRRGDRGAAARHHVRAPGPGDRP
jgi:3'-phosphoadenosine 5'-phosphosulfate sulfotransferase (PAPS reductase)/FAD synthetase